MAAPLYRRSALVAAGPAAAAVWLASASRPVHAEEERSKLSIYSEPPQPVTLVETHTELERQIGSARQALSSSTKELQSSVNGVVEKWIGVEKSVEKKVSELIPKDEPLTPGILYVGVATLTGSVFGRYRSLPIRLISPPLFFFASLNYFLPKTSHNLATYYDSVERAHAPALTEQRLALVAATRDAWAKARGGLQNARKSAEGAVRSGLGEVEGRTGLKVGDALGKVDEAVRREKIKLEDKAKLV